jgi:hypothetical protein
VKTSSCFVDCVVAWIVVCMAGTVAAKEQPPQVVVWPDSGTAVLRFSFGKMKEIASAGNRRSYTIDTTVQNLWGKIIPSASFSLYLFDKSKARIGEGYISLNNVGIGETVKFQVAMDASGVPVTFGLSPRDLPLGMGAPSAARKVSITVNSVPQGALLRVDGVEAGTTPKIVEVGVGKHRLEFNKEGFNPGMFPLEIGANDASGGSVGYELGSSVHDTVELRDGSVISGDLESVSASDVVVRIGGKDAKYDRNQVKRILLVERENGDEPLRPAGQEEAPR